MVEVDSHDKKLPKTEVEEKQSNKLQQDKKVTFTLTIIGLNWNVIMILLGWFSAFKRTPRNIKGGV